tara:strand:+ start:3489 stop:3728 length:240 start_codon:yes stop_codon:yes gene_type:complete
MKAADHVCKIQILEPSQVKMAFSRCCNDECLPSFICIICSRVPGSCEQELGKFIPPSNGMQRGHLGLMVTHFGSYSFDA